MKKTPLTRAAVTDEEMTVWDFSDVTENIPLAEPDAAPRLNYKGLVIVGAATEENKDYITSEGIHFNGASKAESRHVIFSTEKSGVFNVTYRTNGSSKKDIYLANSIPAETYIVKHNATSGVIGNRFEPGTYYVGIGGGMTLSLITFEPDGNGSV